MTKKIEGFINKMFKMADGYLTEHNNKATEKLTRVQINSSFDAFKKKKDAYAKEQAAAP